MCRNCHHPHDEHSGYGNCLLMVAVTTDGTVRQSCTCPGFC